ncbi:hypothetical protein IW262DRAFT_338110 [Armillaria fumosa]|nr:hypothetical protein IW262DRAFT_338110 [Armillaria fumosa]
MHQIPEDAKVEAKGGQGYAAITDVGGMLSSGVASDRPSTGPTRLTTDFSVPNPHLYDGPSDRLPPNWRNDWKRFPFRRRLFALVNGRIFASLEIELHHHVSGEIYVVMYHRQFDEFIIRIGTRYFTYNFETEVLLEFIHAYPTLDAFLDLASQWDETLSQVCTLTPFVEKERFVTPYNYYEEVKKWEEEVAKARAADTSMDSHRLCYLSDVISILHPFKA